MTLLLISLHQSVEALSSTDAFRPVNDAAMKLVQFCIDPKAGLDENAVAILADYVLSSKQARGRRPPEIPGMYRSLL